MQSRKAFSLVELIVVITIGTIISTIGFITYTSYTKNSRDSVRKADLETIETSLEMYFTENTSYPSPENPVSIQYSGEDLWSQGVFGNSVRSQLKDFSYTPFDTLTNNLYSYSVISDGKEYEIGTIFESQESQVISSLFPQTYAFNKKKARSYIIGNYNGILTKTQIAGIDYLLVTPSIITNDLNITDFTTILNQNKLAYKGFGNLPASYTDSSFDVEGGANGILVNTGATFVVFSGNLGDITKEKESDVARIALIEALQLSYQGTFPELINESIQKLVSLDTTTVDAELIREVRRIINNIFHVHLSLD